MLCYNHTLNMFMPGNKKYINIKNNENCYVKGFFLNQFVFNIC